jgi:hypothetical protein
MEKTFLDTNIIIDIIENDKNKKEVIFGEPIISFIVLLELLSTTDTNKRLNNIKFIKERKIEIIPIARAAVGEDLVEKQKKFIQNINNKEWVKNQLEEIVDLKRMIYFKWGQAFTDYFKSILYHLLTEYVKESKVNSKIKEKLKLIISKLKKEKKLYFENLKNYNDNELEDEVSEIINKELEKYRKKISSIKKELLLFMEKRELTFLVEMFWQWANYQVVRKKITKNFEGIYTYSLEDSYKQLVIFFVGYFFLKRNIKDNRKFQGNDIFDALIIAQVDYKNSLESSEKNIKIFIEEESFILKECWQKILEQNNENWKFLRNRYPQVEKNKEALVPRFLY